jgi:hypothetical protein
MPELELKFLDSRKLVTNSELVISDVCAECNNVKLSPLDNYLCLMFDKYFQTYIEKKRTFKFEYDYELLLRTLLKVTFNSSRTKTRVGNEFEKFKNYILDNDGIREDVVIKLDLITPSMHNGKKIYPKSARCGIIATNFKQENFILRMIAVNSFYFYIIISKNEKITTEIAELELRHIIENIPGTIVHPYQKEIEVKNFSDFDTFSIHQNHILSNQEHYDKFLRK